jgi:hypothetical protein
MAVFFPIQLVHLALNFDKLTAFIHAESECTVKIAYDQFFPAWVSVSSAWNAIGRAHP